MRSEPSELAEALVQAGQYQQAETMARSHTDPYYQAQALSELTGVAEALAKADCPVQARRVVALALRLGSSSDETWIVPLGALVSLQPPALHAVAEDVCREHRG